MVKPILEHQFEWFVGQIVTCENETPLVPRELSQKDFYEDWKISFCAAVHLLSIDKEFVEICRKLECSQKIDAQYKTLELYVKRAFEALFPVAEYHRNTVLESEFRQIILASAKLTQGPLEEKLIFRFREF